MTIRDIVEMECAFAAQAASDGFCCAVETNCGFDIDQDQIMRIAAKAETADKFQTIFENEDWWVNA